MLKHYLRHTLRLVRKQPLYAGINVLGLSVALGVATLIVLFVQDELGYDDWHERADRIVRVDDIDFNPDGSVDEQSPWQPYPFAEALRREHPDVEKTVRFNDADVVIRDGQAMHPVSAMFADDTFFEVFSYRAVHGALGSALTDPTSLVLTESGAVRLFGQADVVGRTVEVRFDATYEPAEVTAVVADPPASTNVPFDVLMPFHRLPLVYPWIANRVDRWNASSFPTYALLREGADLKEARATVRRLWTTFYPDRTERGRTQGWWTGEGDPSTLDMVPLRELHLRSDVEGAFVATSNPVYSWILLGIGALILALACINFTLLAVGQSSTRASEIGVRKALGARRNEIITQFGGEAVVLALVGLAGGLLFASGLLPAASSLAGKDLELDLLASPGLLLGLAAIALLTGVAAGMYPSLVISRHKASDTLRGRFQLTASGALTRGLLVTQFAGSVVLVVGALAMKAQLDYLRSRDLGYDGENVIVVSTRGLDGVQARDYLEGALEPHAAVGGVSGISLSLNRGYSSVGWMADDVERKAYEYNVAADLTELLEMDLVAGRDFDPLRSTDSTTVLVNESFAADWGWSVQEAVGKQVTGFGRDPEIIGVLEDMNFRSQHEAVSPTIFAMEGSWMGYVLVKAEAGRTAEAIAALQDAWTDFAPDTPLSYTFMDEDVALAYENDRRWARIVRAASALAILVACLGLFGLAALTVNRRTKEIGIRKVLGATARDVAVLVTGDFALMVAFATLIAAPFAYAGLNRWLDGFAYRIQLEPWLFLVGGGVVLTIALLTVVYHSVRAALADPVQSLRYE